MEGEDLEDSIDESTVEKSTDTSKNQQQSSALYTNGRTREFLRYVHFE